MKKGLWVIIGIIIVLLFGIVSLNDINVFEEFTGKAVGLSPGASEVSVAGSSASSGKGVVSSGSSGSSSGSSSSVKSVKKFESDDVKEIEVEEVVEVEEERDDGAVIKSTLKVQENNGLSSKIASKVELETAGNKITATLSDGSEIAVNILPGAVVSVVSSEWGVGEVDVELIEKEGRVVYEAKALIPGRILWIFRTNMEVGAEIDAETGNVEIKRPGWAFIFSPGKGGGPESPQNNDTNSTEGRPINATNVTRANNTLIGGKPDLTIINAQAVNVNYYNDTASNVTFRADIKNIGRKDAGASMTEFIYFPWLPSDSIYTPTIPSGETRFAEANVIITKELNYNIEVNADYRNWVDESNEDNNNYNFDYILEDNRPDLIVESWNISIDTYNQNGSLVWGANITANVKNIGDEFADFTYTKFVFPGFNHEYVFTQRMGPGRHEKVNLLYLGLQNNTWYNINATADHNNRLDESNEDNNEGSTRFFV